MSKNVNSALSARTLAVLQEAVAEVMAKSRPTSKPMAVWRNGQPVWMTPETAAVLDAAPSVRLINPPSLAL